MGTCKECKKVVNFNELQDGYCKACRHELFDDAEASQAAQVAPQDVPKEENSGSATCGIVSLVLGVLSLFTGAMGLLFVAVGIGCGISGRKNSIGMAGLVVSSIAAVIVVTKMLAIAFFISQAHS
jgi:hypothetical protein